MEPLTTQKTQVCLVLRITHFDPCTAPESKMAFLGEDYISHSINPISLPVADIGLGLHDCVSQLATTWVSVGSLAR